MTEQLTTFNDYQKFTHSLAVYNEDVELIIKNDDEAFVSLPMTYTYPILALAEEAGEVAGKLAKFVRKSKGGVDPLALRDMVIKELGDVLYQVSETARQFEVTLQDVVDMNVAKLTDRADRGVLVGEGDNR